MESRRKPLQRWPLVPAAVAALVVSATGLDAQVTTPTLENPRLRAQVRSDGVTAVADPKLAGGGVEVAFHLDPPGITSDVAVDVLQGGAVVTTLWVGTLAGGAPPTQLAWDGRDDQGDWVDTGPYTVRVAPLPGATPVRPLLADVHVVRLGIVEVEAQDGAGDDEFQMVYFMRGSSYAFTATPAFAEYRNAGGAGEVSDLDQDDGAPRPSVAVHTDTATPKMSGSTIESDRFNYPLAYVRGAAPRLEVTLGETATSAAGTLMGAGYPVSGYDLRLTGSLGGVPFGSSGPLAPGGVATFDLPPLPDDVTRVDLPVAWTWQYARAGSDGWVDVPGSTAVAFRVYTTFGEPNFRPGVSGVRYAGPWVEVAEYWYQWSAFVGADTSTAAGVVENHVKGFFGQNSGIPAPIEGVLYDAWPLGGDGGATHYFDFDSERMGLSELLNGHDNGVYVNCSDNMGATTTMLAMMGVDGMRPVRLGNMQLKAIWGIGAPGYTTNLWGTGHGFSYHHIVTRDDGVHVSDTCMQLDEDGNPGSTPGIPGWNTDRPWAGTGGYDDLSSYNIVSKTLETLPGLE